MASKRKNVNQQMLRSTLNGGRYAGMGISYDDYGDESMGPQEKQFLYGYEVKMPNDGVDPEELDGPVEIVQEGSVK